MHSWHIHGTPHLNVRSDYTDTETETGIRRKHTYTYGEVVMLGHYYIIY